MVLYDFDCPINQVEDKGEEDCELPEELARLLRKEEKVIQPHQEDIEVINLGTKEDKKEVNIGASIQDAVKTRLIEFLYEYADVFVWSYQDMFRLDTDLIVHKFLLEEEYPTVKKKLRRTRPNMALKIIEEVRKNFDDGFFAVEKYPQWTTET